MTNDYWPKGGGTSQSATLESVVHL